MLQTFTVIGIYPDNDNKMFADVVEAINPKSAAIGVWGYRDDSAIVAVVLGARSVFAPDDAGTDE